MQRKFSAISETSSEAVLIANPITIPTLIRPKSYLIFLITAAPGLSSLGVPGVPWHTQIWADQLTLFPSWGTDYSHLITTGTPGFSDLPTALK